MNYQLFSESDNQSDLSDRASLRTNSSLKVCSTQQVSHVEALKTKNYDFQLGLFTKGLNFGHLNIQGICGRDMSKFSEIEDILKANQNLHVLGLSKTKLKDHKPTSMFHVEGFQRLERIMTPMAVGESWYT